MQTNEIALKDQLEKGFYTSLKANTEEDKKKIYNALETCDKLLNNCVGEQIKLKDIYIESFIRHDEATNRDIPKYRTILFAEDGTTYVTTAYGVYNALRKIITIYGEPQTWDGAKDVQVVKRPVGNGKETLTLKLV